MATAHRKAIFSSISCAYKKSKKQREALYEAQSKYPSFEMTELLDSFILFLLCRLRHKMHATKNDTRLDVERYKPQMVSPVCEEITLVAHVFVSFGRYDVLIFVPHVHNLAEKGKDGGGDHLAYYHENLNPEPHFKCV